MMTEGREVGSDRITQYVVHPAFHQDYEADFRSQRVCGHCPHPHISPTGGDHQQYVSPQEANNT